MNDVAGVRLARLRRDQRLCGPPSASSLGWRAVRRLHPRALRDRRLVLPDHALGVVVPRTTEEALAALAIARERACRSRRAAAAPRNAARPSTSGLIVDTSKHLNRILSLDAEKRTCVGRARHRAGRPQSSAEAARTVVSGRRLDGVAGHHRRHGRQQLLRRALAALRHDARQHAVDGAALADGTLLDSADAARPARAQRGRAGARPLPRPAGARRARGGRGRGALSQGAAARRRLQPRRARAERAEQQHGPRARRLRGDARLHHRGRAEALAGDPQQACSASATSAASTRPWMRRSTSSP